MDGIRALLADPRLEILKSALGASAALHVVGGSVRNAMLGLPTGDLDLASALLPGELAAELAARGIRSFPTGLRHQTVTALPIEGAEGVEITTFRGPNMNPESGIVRSETIEEDLCYRDFTMNALAVSVAGGVLIDPTGGLDDLRRGVLRAPGAPLERFREDPLRVLRLIRFACAFGFTIDEATERAARESVPAVAKTSIERARDEISKILISPAPARGFRLLADYGLLKLLLPEIHEMVGVEQNEFHYADVFEHTLEVVEKTSNNLVLRLSALLHDVGKPRTLTIDADTGSRHFYLHEAVGTEMTREILTRLRYPGSVVEGVASLVQTHMRPLEAGPGGVRRLLRDTGELFSLWRELKVADASSVKIPESELAERFRAFDELVEEVAKGPPVSPLKSLAVNGHDLMAAGFPEGRRIGEVLRALHEQVLDDPSLNTKEELLRRAAELAK